MRLFEKASCIFRRCILLELAGKLYTRSLLYADSNIAECQANAVELISYCRQNPSHYENDCMC